MDEAFATSAVVSLHCPLKPENKAFVNAELLSKARKGLVLINTARGGLIDEKAVAEALHSGHLAAYACDVLAQEPPAADNPHTFRAQCLCHSPHCLGRCSRSWSHH